MAVDAELAERRPVGASRDGFAVAAVNLTGRYAGGRGGGI